MKRSASHEARGESVLSRFISLMRKMVRKNSTLPTTEPRRKRLIDVGSFLDSGY
jgi:hypothetical protein